MLHQVTGTKLGSLLSVKPSSQYDARPRDATHCDVVRLSLGTDFSTLSDVVRLAAGDAMQSYNAVLTSFGMTSHASRDLAMTCVIL